MSDSDVTRSNRTAILSTTLVGGAGERCVAIRFGCLIVMGCLINPAAIGQVAIAGAPKIVIALKSHVNATHNPVLLGDVADIVTDDPQLTAQLSAIDLADLASNQPTIIKQRRIAVRLQLAGIAADRFQVVGADRVHVVASGPLAASPSPVVEPPVLKSTDVNPPPIESATLVRPLPSKRHPARQSAEQQILELLRGKLSEQWMVTPSQVEVRLLQPLPSPKATFVGQVSRYEVTIAADQKAGTLRPHVYCYQGDRLVDVWTIGVSALRQYETVVVTRSVAQGHVLTQEDVESRRQFLRERGQLASLSGVLERAVRRPLDPGQSIHTYDLQPTRSRSSTSRAASNPSVRRRDTVRLVAHAGGLTVTIANGLALEDAAIGESIRVRNPRSNQIIVGRVVSSNQVEVAF